MDKLYLLESDNKELLNREIDKILSNIDNPEVIKYDLSNKDTIVLDTNKMIEELDTYDMFSKQKVVICNSPIFLNEKVENELESFNKYINNPSDNILIITIDKINNKLKIVNNIKNIFKVIEIKDVNYQDFIKQNLDNYKMDSKTINYFLNSIGNNITNILNELNKLKLLKLDTHEILISDIDNITTKTIDSTIFELIDAIVDKDKNKIIELYNYFINNGTEFIQIIIMLSNKIRLIYNVKVLSKFSDFDISKILDVKEYPVKLARNKSYNFTKKELLKMLYNFSNMEYEFKTSNSLVDYNFISYLMTL